MHPKHPPFPTPEADEPEQGDTLLSIRDFEPGVTYQELNRRADELAAKIAKQTVHLGLFPIRTLH